MKTKPKTEVPYVVLPYMRNGWTGGQYSVFRLLLGTFLFVHFVQLTRWAWGLLSSGGFSSNEGQDPLIGLFATFIGLDDGSGLLLAVTVGALVASLFLVVGIFDKWAASFLCLSLACLYGGDPLIANQSMHYLGWMLIVHLLMPKAPYGSLAAVGRPDPGGGWRFPFAALAGTLFIFSISYLHSSWDMIVERSWAPGHVMNLVLLNPLPPDYLAHGVLSWLPPASTVIVGFAIQGILFFVMPFDYSRRVHPLFWCAAFGLQLDFAFRVDFADPAVTMLLFHLIVFHPAWIRSRQLPERATLFYDGTCGLCHRLVRFVLAEDVAERITFSPLGSDYCRTALTVAERSGLPDSMVLKSDAGLLLEGDAAIRILKMLGGLWLLLALFLSAFPARWRKAAYNFIGERRYRFFGRTENACPIVSPRLRSRFAE